MDKRVLVSDEFELRSLRIRFLTVSEQITGQLAGLAQRIGDAPPARQASLLVLAGQIAAAQQRLRDETDRLAGHPAECTAILQITLPAQLAVSSQLENILAADQTLSHLDSKLANIAQKLARVHGPEPRPVDHQTWEGAERGEHDDPSIDEDTWPRHPVACFSEAEEPSRISEDNPTYVALFAKIGAGLSAAATFRSLAVTGCLLCALVLAFARFTAGGQHEVAMRSLPASEPKIAAVPRVRPPLSRPQVSEARAAYAQAILPAGEAPHERDPDVPVTAAPEPMPPSSAAHAPALQLPERNVAPAPQADNWGGTVASALPLAASKPVKTIPSYVSVVFTH